MSQKSEHILVIRLGALGDLVFCFQAFHEIRQAHPDAHITLLIRKAYSDFAKALPWFDDVLIESHPSMFDFPGWVNLVKKIKTLNPSRIYDLQGKNRQTVLYFLLGGPLGPEWSGAAIFCKFPRPWPPKPEMHFTEFLAAQLRAIPIAQALPFDLTTMDAPIDTFSLPALYVVLIPSCSPSAPQKRWPADKYGALALALQKKGLSCLAIGTEADSEVVAKIQRQAPAVINLCGKTNIKELAGILRGALGVIGNDTGPTHLAAALDVPTLALFSSQSNPKWSKPPGGRVNVLAQKDLKDLGLSDVLENFEALIKHSKSAS